MDFVWKEILEWLLGRAGSAVPQPVPVDDKSVKRIG